MKVYAFGEPDAPAIVLLPGTCCDCFFRFR